MFKNSAFNPVLRLLFAETGSLIWRWRGVRSSAADVSPTCRAKRGMGYCGPTWPLVGLIWAMRRVRVLLFHFMDVIPILLLLIILIREIAVRRGRGARRGLILLRDRGLTRGTQATG